MWEETSEKSMESLKMEQWYLLLQVMKSMKLHSAWTISAEASRNSCSSTQHLLVCLLMPSQSISSVQLSVYIGAPLLNNMSEILSQKKAGKAELFSWQMITISMLMRWRRVIWGLHLMVKWSVLQQPATYPQWFYWTCACITNGITTCLTDGKIRWTFWQIIISTPSWLGVKPGGERSVIPWDTGM